MNKSDSPPYKDPKEFNRAMDFMKSGFYSSEIGLKVVQHLEWVIIKMRATLERITCTKHFVMVASENYQPPSEWCFQCMGTIMETQRDKVQEELLTVQASLDKFMGQFPDRNGDESHAH